MATVDFKNAAIRHYRDAEFLYADSRLPNADHLYGLSAECSLKAIIVGLDSACVDSNTGDFNSIGRIHKKHFEHHNSNKDLWNHFSVNFSGRLAGQFSLPVINPFADWDIFQRYFHDSYFNQINVQPHRTETIKLLEKADELFTSGVL